MSASIPVVDLSSDTEAIDLTVPLPAGRFYIRDSKTGLPSVWNQQETCGWIPDDTEIVSSPTRPNRSRAHRPASPVIRESAIDVPVPVDEAWEPIDRDVLARPVGVGVVLGERSVYEIEGTSAAGRGMVLDDSVRRLFAAYESRITELESLVQALEDRVGVTEVGLLAVQQQMSGMAKLPMTPTTRTGGSSGSTPLPSSSEELSQVIAQQIAAAIAQQNANWNASVRMETWSKVGDLGKKVVEAGEKFGDVEKKPFDEKGRIWDSSRIVLVSRRREIRILIRLMLQMRLVLLVGKPFAKDAENRGIKLRFVDLRRR
ncbi:hypothetical protein L1987_18661 [Smallanthus sonchifolius]|uniref:Uncharacterized protein n=1 Tax=Smallanthus sonchifolius TaxID=185202 RepID=A0ACB9J2E7_9ASTR|nr:hypothetical protein L1987_18661 [Smallanthus sonchifolius]